MSLLSAHNLLLAFSGLLLLRLIVAFFQNHAQLRDFKGPRLAAYTRFWIFKEEVAGRLPHSQRAALKKYGSPCRIGPNLLVTDDADLIRHMNAPGSRWTRSSWYEAMRMDPRQDNVFSTRDEKLHAELKAKEYGGYNSPSIEPLIDSLTLQLLSLISTSHPSQPFDLSSTIRFYVLDVLSTVAFAGPFGFMAQNADLWDYQKTSNSFMLLLGLSANHTFFRSLLSHPWMQYLAAPKLTDTTGLGPALKFARDAVATRFEPTAEKEKEQKRDLLGHFVAKGLSQTQCEVEAFLQIAAGSDSTTTVLRSTLFLLASHPVAYSKLRAAVDAAVTSRPVIKYTEALRLPYLQACIWEGARLYPPLFGLKSKTSPPDGETIQGVYYPPGTEVAICDDGVMRNEEVFGERVDVFEPERFLVEDEEVRGRRWRTVEVVFGSGRFLCLGRGIAMMEMNKAIFEIFKSFDLVPADPMRGIDMVRHNVHVQSEMNVVAYPRSR
ncbi:cytochrome p450 like protein [Zymoseptoria brevis]|uniref:Cytochrome p450 like protein n=1 Tax=Zymoseptoria brevis TaxID=1047168 RepID=A0A0F4GCQ4_9PEZI|nr:cytochrome p450 like protein [Zymoseptoria brevis]